MDNTENLALLHKARNGDSLAAQRLVTDNIGLVRSVARRFEGRGQEYEDLCQIGTIGLMRAVRNFDERFGCAFSTYAVHSITGELKRFLRDDGLIKISREIKRRGYMLTRAREDYIKEHGCAPHLSELCALCGIKAEEAAEAMAAQSPLLSFESGTDDDAPTLSELTGEDDSEQITEKIALHEAIGTLAPEERALLYWRYFRGMTQTESAQCLGMTQVKVSRTEKKIMEKLRRALSG